MSREIIFRRALERLIARHPEGVTISLGWGDVVGLVATLQLALRHPGNTGPTAAAMRSLVDSLIAGVEEREPELARLLRLGDDPSEDVRR